MYTFNLYVFGHNLSIDKELNNSLNSFDIELKTKIGDRTYEIDFPYNGGQTSGDTYSCVFGTTISTDEFNPNHVKEIRSFKKEYYIEEYKEFIEYLKIEVVKFKGEDGDMDMVIDNLIKFIDTHEPELYSVQASS